jgi:hypothetical protein
VCENPGEAIEVHAYTSSAHSTTICTMKFPAQAGLTGGFMTNVEEGEQADITITDEA